MSIIQIPKELINIFVNKRGVVLYIAKAGISKVVSRISRIKLQLVRSLILITDTIEIK